MQDISPSVMSLYGCFLTFLQQECFTSASPPPPYKKRYTTLFIHPLVFYASCFDAKVDLQTISPPPPTPSFESFYFRPKGRGMVESFAGDGIQPSIGMAGLLNGNASVAQRKSPSPIGLKEMKKNPCWTERRRNTRWEWVGGGVGGKSLLI